MASDSTPPPYEDAGLSGDEKPAVAAMTQRTDDVAGHSTPQQNKDEVRQPRIVLFVSCSKTKGSKTPVWKSQRDAIMLSPSSSYRETILFLLERLEKQKSALKIPEDAETQQVLFYTVQDGSKDPWLDSNWHNTVHIHDEESWRACKALLAKNDRSLLMFLLSVQEDLEALAEEMEEIEEIDKKKKEKEKRRSCVVQ